MDTHQDQRKDAAVLKHSAPTITAEHVAMIKRFNEDRLLEMAAQIAAAVGEYQDVVKGNFPDNTCEETRLECVNKVKALLYEIRSLE